MRMHHRLAAALILLVLAALLAAPACFLGDDGSGGVEGDPWTDADPYDCGGNNYTWSSLKGRWNYLATGGLSGWIEMNSNGKITSWTYPPCSAWDIPDREADMMVTVTCGGLVRMTGASKCEGDPSNYRHYTVFKLKFDGPTKLIGIFYLDYTGNAKAIYMVKVD